ncbi:MAG: M48 family metalloprotease [Pyrobaculum sp.]
MLEGQLPLLVAVGYLAAIGLSLLLYKHLVDENARWVLWGYMALVGAVMVGIFVFLVSPILFPLVWVVGAITRLDYLLAALVLAVVAGVVMYTISPLFLTKGLQPDPQLQAVVDRVARRLGVRGRVKAAVTDGPPNAYAFGNFLTGRYVVVSKSLMSMLNEKELEAVVGHELGHHIHKDMPLIISFGVPSSLLYYTGMGAIAFGLLARRAGSDRWIVPVIYGIVAVVASFIVQQLVLALSRVREHLADLVGAVAAGKDAMQSALAKLHKYYQTNEKPAGGGITPSMLKTLYIYALVNTFANPLYDVTPDEIRALISQKTGILEELLSSHPPIPKRLAYIEELFNPYYL